MRADDMKRLVRIQAAVLEAGLARLRAANAAREETRAALAGLARPATPNADPGLSGAAAELAELTYQRWADTHRADLNARLARQTATWIEARDDARAEFGRDQAFRTLLDRQRARKPEL